MSFLIDKDSSGGFHPTLTQFCYASFNFCRCEERTEDVLLVMVLSSPANSWHHDLCIGVPKRSGIRLCGEGMAASGKGGCSNNRGQ